jgi:hypothetical protein
MALFLVTYDLNRPGQEYPKLYEAIKSLGNAWHGMESVWFLRTSRSAYQIVDYLRQFVDRNDKVFASLVTSDSAWYGFNQDGTTWLQNGVKESAGVR